MLAPALDSSLVRILTDGKSPRRPVGAGFLVTPQHIVTCAHVVNTALGRAQNTNSQPDALILVDFPLLNSQILAQATILHWHPVRDNSSIGDLSDIAVLELLPDNLPPAGSQPAPILVIDSGGEFHEVKMCGFPLGVTQGTYAKGSLQGLNAKGWVEIHHQGNEIVEQGFSGTAVWAVEKSAVCGMIVGILKRTHSVVAYMIPASTLFRAFPNMPLPINPYKGLEAFREKDARFYFGRDEAIAHLKKIAETQSFTAVIGASGSGKSSLVFAGLIPALRKSGDWLIADCRPLNQPFYELSVRLVSFLYEDPLQRSEKTEELKANFDASTVSLSSVISQIRERHDRRHFLLIIDQFEELYTPNADKALSRSFLGQVLETAQTEGFSAVVTLRADFLAAAGSCGVFAGILNSSPPVFIPSIDKENLQQVVERPAALQHVVFEPGLVDLIVSEAGDGPGSLPLLEFCLTQLWEKQECRQITHAAYQGIGGVQQALAVHADEVYGRFNAADKERVRHIFLKLVRPGQGTEDTRQAAAFAQFEPEYHGLIKRLADRRLLVTGQDAHSGESTVEIVHETLLHHWTTLREWVDKEREFLVWREKLKVLLRQWRESRQDDSALLRGLPLDEALRWQGSHAGYLTEEEGEFVEESEAARVKQRRRKNTAFAAALLIAAVVAAVFSVLWTKAERQRGVAEQKTTEARYNVAKAFEGKALTALEAAEQEGNVEEYKKVVLFASAAFEQKIKSDESSLSLNSVGKVFAAEVFKSAFAERWASSKQKAADRSKPFVSFSPDGKQIASAIGKNVRLWDSATGEILKAFDFHSADVRSVVFSPDGRQIASVSNDRTIRLSDIETGRELKIFQGHNDDITSVFFGFDGKTIASASYDKTVRVWDTKNGKVIMLLKGQSRISSSSNGKRLVIFGDSNVVQILDSRTGIVLRNIFCSVTVSDVAFSPDGNWIALGLGDGVMQIMNVESGKKIKTLRGHEKRINSVSFSADGKRIVSTSHDKTILIRDFDTGEIIKILPGHVARAVFSPDGKLIVSISFDNVVQCWNVDSGKTSIVLRKHPAGDFNSASFSPDGQKILSISSNKIVLLWDVNTGEVIENLLAPASFLNAAFSPDGRLVAFASADKKVRIWNMESKIDDWYPPLAMKILKGHDGWVTSVSFSPDGKSLASSSSDNTVRIWDVETEDELTVLKGHSDSVESAVYHPNGKKLASASNDNTVRVWDVWTGKLLNVLKGHDGWVTSISLSPDGKTLASSSSDNTVRIWDINSGKALNIMYGHTAPVRSVAFNPNGELIASGSIDNMIRIWDSESGHEITKLSGHTGWVNSVSFSPDSRKLASASADNTVRIWDMRSYTLFLHNSKPTPLYHTFIEAVKFLWQLDVQGLEIVHKERTPADMEKFGTLLVPPPPGQSKFDQVLEWAEKQQQK